jgi:hypothetical protein
MHSDVPHAVGSSAQSLVGAGNTYVLWNNPMDQEPGLQVLFYLAGRIASPVGANLITLTIFIEI